MIGQSMLETANLIYHTGTAGLAADGVLYYLLGEVEANLHYDSALKIP